MNNRSAHLVSQRLRSPAALAMLMFSLAASAIAAEPNTVRLAVGPFFAPPANDRLRQDSQIIPELLVVELSHLQRFQLVEREKVQTVWSELNLSASGLVARDTVAKLGRVLACDWVVSGSLVQTAGKTHIWTKVIDVRDGVVLDLNATPYEAGSVSNVISHIAAFVGQAGTHPKGRQFIVMGPFVDMNPSLGPKREDWSRRIAALIEKHFIEIGFGVVEMAAIGPIFEERRLETAGLTGHPEGRVKLQAAFWLLDGGCHWAEGTPLKLEVGLRAQRIGGPEQIFHLSQPPGEAIEKALVETLALAVANTNAIAAPEPNAEADLLASRGMELATRRSPFTWDTSGPKRSETQWDAHKRMLEQQKNQADNRNAALATYERTLLRDPNNLEAKTMLGYALLGDLDPARREHGKELLAEVVATNDPKYHDRAQAHLTNAARIARIVEQDARPRRRPDDLRSLKQAVAENPADLEARCNFGAALLQLPRATDRERGRKLLGEVVAGDRQDQADRARKLLAQPEPSPALRDVPENSRATAGRPSTESPAVSSAPEAAPEPEQPEIAARNKFLQENFSKFVPARFEKDGPTEALMQRVPVQESMFDYEGRHFCGFRFTIPLWADGNFAWMFLLAKTEAGKDFKSGPMDCYIVPKTGTMTGFRYFDSLEVANYPKLKERFPYTPHVTCQGLPMGNFKRGEEYAIWFAFKKSNMVDIAFALSINSARGTDRVGKLPLH